MARAVTVPSSVASPGLRTRVFLGTAAIVAVVIAAAFAISAASVRRAGETSARRGLEQSADLVAQFLTGRSRTLAGGARVFVQGPYFRALVAEQRRDDILDQAIEASEQLGADWVFITDGNGRLLAKSDEPAAFGASLGNVPLVAGGLRGLTASGFGVTRDSLLFQAVAVPIATPAGAPLGVLVATRIVDAPLVRDVKATTSSDLLVYVRAPDGSRRVSLSTLPAAVDVSRALAALPERVDSTAAANAGIAIAGVDYLAQGSALTTAGGDVVGGFVVLRSRDAELVGLRNLRRSLAVAGILGLLLAWMAAYVAARSIARPVHLLSAAVRRATAGEYAGEFETVVQSLTSTREIHELGTAFAALLTDLRDKDRLTGLSAPAAATDSAPAPRGSGRLTIGGGPRGRVAPRPGVQFEPGELIANRYLVEAVLGSGGLGIVYRVRDRVIGETVALKVLRPEALAEDPQATRRLADEMRLARRVTHRNVVRMHDIGDADGTTFITMEHVDGASLATIIASRGALEPAAVLSIGRQLMRALGAMHADGIVHGDLKPANLLIGPNGVLKVTDFGIARLVRRTDRDGARDVSRAAALPQISGAVIGTPEYMAPEQLIGAPASTASDLYAAGVVLHECLRGTTPFDAETRTTFLAHKLDTATIHAAARGPAAAAGVQDELEAVVAQLMAVAPEARPASAAAVLDALAVLG